MTKFVILIFVMMLTVLSAWSQTHSVSGKVTDQNGNPVPFATVKVKGGKGVVVGNNDGSFTIHANNGDVLTISAVNYESADATVTGDIANATLKTSIGSLQEVVVTTALGIQRQAKSLGYSTTKISGDEINQAKVTSVATGLAAKVSGLQVNLVNSGVKQDVRITLRGNRSFLGQNQPLLVVDGNLLPIRFLNSINPNDIESSNFLKGASASALYGSDASNGVIIIVTKKGKGKPQINVSSTISLEDIAYTAKFQDRFGQGSSETPSGVPGLTEGNGLTYFPDNPFQPYVWYENQNYGPEFNGQTVNLGFPVRIFNDTGGYVDKFRQIKYSAIPNVKKKFFDQGVTWQNDISYSGGDANNSFYLSFQDVDIKGTVPKDVNHRNTFRVNGSKTIGKFRADYNVTYAISHANTTPGSQVPFRWGEAGFGGLYSINAIGSAPRLSGGSYFQGRPVYWNVINQPADVDLRDYRNWQTDPFASPDGYFNAYYGNPWWQIDQDRLDERNNDFIGSAALNFKATDWLDFTYRFGFSRNDYNNKYTKAGFIFADWAANLDYGANVGSIPTSLTKLDPTAGTGFSYNQKLTSDFLAEFKKTFFDELDVTLILGNQIQANTFKQISLTANALVVPDFYNIQTNKVGEPPITEFLSAYRNYGIFGDLTLGYKNFLFGHFSLRNDWTSLLSDANRSFLYPGGDVAFVFSDLISDKPSWWSYGKVRGAISKTGQV
ncbi:MAG: TonB-dependent receptor plug domain-containing protein, partial [Parafilimonas sp.]